MVSAQHFINEAQDVHVFLSSVAKKLSFFEVNIPGFFFIQWTFMVASGLKIKNAVSIKLQRALHDPSRARRVLSKDGRIDPKVSILSILMLYRKDRSSHKNIDSKVHFFVTTNFIY